MANNVMEQTQETKKTLFSVEQNGFISYYDMGVMSLEELRQHFMESGHPFKGLGGKELSESDFAQLEQSGEVSLSVTADIDNDMIKVYEINGIPEEERTDENTRIQYMDISEYISEKQMIETNIGSIPIEDYREIEATKYGFDSYEDFYEAGYRLGNNLDKAPDNLFNSKNAEETLNQTAETLSDAVQDNQMKSILYDSPIQQAEHLINCLESTKTVFNNDERNLIVNYAYKLNDIEKTRELAERIYYNHGNQEAILAKHEAQAEIDALPDSMIGLYEMEEYGYMYKNMLPLTQERALELFEQDLSLYMLHEDGTENMVENRGQIMEHAGIFGIEKDEWMQPQKESREAANKNKSQEQTDVLFGEKFPKQEFKEITVKFGAGCVGKQFQGKDGNQYRQILVPPNKDTGRPWTTFVVKANHVHENQYGKGMWIKLPSEGNTTIKWSVDVSQKDSPIKEFEKYQEKIPNTALKKIMEEYKDRPKESALGKLKLFQNKAKEQNAAKETPIRSKETGIEK